MIERARDLWRAMTPRAHRLVWAGVLALALYAAFGFFAVPRIIRAQVLHQAALRLHRSATVAKVSFNPFTLAVLMAGFELRDHDRTQLAAFDTLVVNFSIGSIPRRALVLDEFRLVRPVIVARLLADGRPAIADLLPAKADPPPGPAPAAPHGAPATAPAYRPPRLLIHKAAVSVGAITFRDESRHPLVEAAFNNLGIAVNGLSTLPEDKGDHTLVVTFGGGAQITWKGTSSFQPLRLEGEVGITGIRPARISELFGAHWPLLATDGGMELMVRYVVDQATDGTLQLTIPTARLDAHQLALRPPGAAEDWARLPAMEVRGVRAMYPQRTAHVDLVRLSRLWLAVTRESDGTLSWQRLADSLRAHADTARTAAPPWAAVVDTFEIDSATIAVTDRTITPEASEQLSQLLVRLHNVTTDSTARTGVECAAALGTGRMRVSGGMTRAPFNADLDIEATALPLARGQPWLGHAAPIRLLDGAASARGHLVMRGGRPSMRFDGGASVERLTIADSAGDSLLTWRTMSVRGIRYTKDPDLLRIANIALERPFARIAINRNRELNLSALSALASSDTTSRLPYEILVVDIKDGLIDFSDQSLVLPFRTLIDSAQGSIRDVASFGGTPGALDLSGRILPAGTAGARGTLNVADPLAATTISAEIRNFVMSDLTPYSAQFMGYAIQRGRLDMDLNYRIEGRQLHADHHIVTTNLELGAAVEGGESPGFLVRLALSLMHDSQGRITLDVPVEGSVDSPDFSYRAVVWQGVKQILRRVATAPFRFLGHMLGISGEDPELVEFEPGRTDLLPPERIKLDTLSAELLRRPQLTIGVEGRYDSVADIAATQEALLGARVQARRDSVAAHTRGDTSATVLAGILEALYIQQFSRPALDSLRAAHTGADGQLAATPYYAEVRARLLAAMPVPAGLLESLGRQRGAAIAAVLRARPGLDTTRITVTGIAPASRRRAGSPRVASEMSMDAR